MTYLNAHTHKHTHGHMKLTSQFITLDIHEKKWHEMCGTTTNTRHTHTANGTYYEKNNTINLMFV